MSVRTILAPKATDIAWTAEDELIISIIFRTDSYKFTHPFMFKQLQKRLAKRGAKVVGMSSYGEARVSSQVKVTMFGMQMLLAKFFSKPITMAHIDAAEKFALAHFGRPLFARADWEKVVTEYGGMPPLIIRALPEGTVTRGGIPLYSVTCLDEDLFWMSSGFETIILRGVWYPTTIASLDRDTRQELNRFYALGASAEASPAFALHDFGGRGVSCGEQAEIGGAAHLVSFMGSDTVEGVLAANFYYDSPMSAFSVFATEHSVECSFGLDDEGEEAYLRALLANAEPGTIVSIVIDGKDMWRCAEKLCSPEFVELIRASKAKVVFRPDSGDMLEVVPRLIRLQDAAYGHTVNAKGYKVINCVGIIYGDGVDRLNMLTMLGNLMAMGYSPECMVFGSGGALLQKVNRDTLKFAQKGSALLIREADGTEHWLGIAKDPITDPGKKSKEGLMTAVQWKLTGEWAAARLDTGPLSDEFEDKHQLSYYLGQLYNKSNLDQVRARAA